METRKIRKFSYDEIAAEYAKRRASGYKPRKTFSKDEFAAYAQRCASGHKPRKTFSKDELAAYAQRRASGPRIEGLGTSSGPQEPRSDILKSEMDESAGAPLLGTQGEAFGSAGSDVPAHFWSTWNVSIEDTIADQATAKEMISHFLPPRDEVAAETASFEALASDGYSCLAKLIFTHRGLISKVEHEARRVAELSSENSRKEVQNQQLMVEIEELRRRLASAELEKGKEIEAMKLSAIEAAHAAEAMQTNRYLDGFDDCRRMACTAFPSMDFGCLVPFSSTSDTLPMEIPRCVDDGGAD